MAKGTLKTPYISWWVETWCQQMGHATNDGHNENLMHSNLSMLLNLALGCILPIGNVLILRQVYGIITNTELYNYLIFMNLVCCYAYHLSINVTCAKCDKHILSPIPKYSSWF